MSIAQAARASSIGTTACAEAADAGAVAERLVERLPEREAGVLDGVVRAGLEVAARRPRRGRAGRGAPPRRAGGRRSRRRCSRSPAPVPSRPSDSEMSVSPVIAVDVGVRLTLGAPWTRRARGSPRRGPARRLRARGGRPPRRARIREPCGAGTWPATGRSGSARRRRWAARGWSRRRSRRRRCRRPRPTNTQPARRHAAASASASRAHQLEVLGGDLLGQPQRARASARASAPQLRVARRSAAPAPAARRSDHGVEQLVVRRDQPHRAVGAVLGLGEQVERDQLRIDAAARRSRPARSARPDRRCRPPRTPGAWPPCTQALPGPDDHVDRRARLRCRRRARRSPAPRPSGRPRHPAERAGREDHRVRAARRARAGRRRRSAPPPPRAP